MRAHCVVLGQDDGTEVLDVHVLQAESAAFDKMLTQTRC